MFLGETVKMIYLYLVTYKLIKKTKDKKLVDFIKDVGMPVENQTNLIIPEDFAENLNDGVKESNKDLIEFLSQFKGKEIALAW